ncbi:MAG: ABC transporter substrate-binding protein [Erysipelotrichaceae bacterium]|nr:ABC transporter substrate-binding protein [Erysipelotrichaceae bacterium]
MKKIVTLLFVLLLLCACGNKDSGSGDAPAEDKTITVGVNPVPHAEILENAVKPVLEEAGWKLEVVVYQDYVLPNENLVAGELDANYFQTLGYMNGQNDSHGWTLTAVKGVHIEPMGLYSDKYASAADIPDGAYISVPNDEDNRTRALEFLIANGFLNPVEGELSGDTLNGNAEANPHGYLIVELEAAQLPLALADVDASVINGNYALGAGLPATYPALLVESFDAETTIRRTNFIVVLEGNENSEKIQALVDAITSDAVQKYIEDTYKGAVITSFVDPQ